MSKLLAVFCINPLFFEKKRLILHSKSARTGCTSAIQTSLIALGLHRPCNEKAATSHLSIKKSQTNKESEVIMSDYDLYTGREERMQAVIEAASASKESKINFLIDAGILEPSGELAPHLR